jgi:hypothetical protein
MPLAVDVRVELRRRRRATCPICLRRRVLFALDAFGIRRSILDPAIDIALPQGAVEAQAVGYGVAMCLECGGLRAPRP